MASTKWIPPLPAGYEARWDPNQKAYFYINHSNKTTTWVDPRFPAQPHPQPQQPQAHHHAAAQSLNHGAYGRGTSPGQNVAMATMYKQFGSTVTSGSNDDDEDDWEDQGFDTLFANTTGDHNKKVDLQKLHQLKQEFPAAEEDAIRELLLRHNNVTVLVSNNLADMGYRRETVSHPPPRKVDMLERLHAMFPKVDQRLVSDMLTACSNDEKRCRAQLESMGYTPEFPTTHRNDHNSRPSSSTHSARGPSPKRTTSPKPATSPAKPKVSEAEKGKIERKIHGQFKGTDMSVIKMALQVCDYDETRVKAVLERMAETPSSRPSSSRPDTSHSRTRSPSPVPTPSHTSLEPTIMTADFDSRLTPSSHASKRPGTGKSQNGATSKTKTRVPSPKKSTSQTQAQQSQHRAKQVTQMSKDVLSSTIATLNRISNNVNCCRQPPDLPSSNQNNAESQSANQTSTQSSEDAQSHDASLSNQDSARRPPVVSTQPQPQPSHVSEHRTLAKGPDPTLRVGSNKDLLQFDYSPAKGPNPELRDGADPELARGSQGAVGPDRSLHCGPQLNLRQGHSMELLMTAV